MKTTETTWKYFTHYQASELRSMPYCGGLLLAALLSLSACGGGGNTVNPDPATDPADPTPSAVSNLRYEEQRLQWDAVSEASYYQLQTSIDGGDNYNNENVNISVAGYTIELDTQNLYRLRACSASNNCSAYTTFTLVIPNTPRPAVADFNTLNDAGNNSPAGLWSDGTTMWVADNDDLKIYAYNLATKARDEDKDFTQLDSGNVFPTGLWSDGDTMWVSDYLDRIFAYNLATKAPDEDKEFDADRLNISGNTSPAGLWSDGTTMWVVDSTDDRIYAYNLADQERDEDKEFDTLSPAGNNAPIALWSDGTTMWVTDVTDKKVYAYNLTTTLRDSAKDFNILTDAGNISPTGLWADDDGTVWIVNGVWESNGGNNDDDNDKIYAYDFGPQSSIRVIE